MAHLSPGGDTPDGADGRDRGQILLIAGLALGVTFVALALVLNAAIFTENLASRGQTTGGDDAVRYAQEVTRGGAELLTYENLNVTASTDHPTLFARLDSGVGTIDDVLTRQRTGISATASVAANGSASTNGTRLWQANASRAFTNATGAEDWTLAAGVDDTRAFRLQVDNGGLLSGCGLFSDCFYLTVSDGADDWRVQIYDNGILTVEVDDGSGSTETCTSSEATVDIDLTAGTVDGEPCPALSFGEAPDSGYDITYSNADEVTGTYSLVVDDPAIASGGTPSDYAVGSNSPNASVAVYELVLDADYGTADIDYTTPLRLAPGEPDA